MSNIILPRISPLNDGTKGFRFNILGQQGLYRKRNSKKRRGISSGSTMIGYHYGKRSLYLEHGYSKRKLQDFAG